MAKPKKKQTKTRKRNRASHFALDTHVLAMCACGSPRLPHQACPACGKYKESAVFEKVYQKATVSTTPKKVVEKAPSQKKEVTSTTDSLKATQKKEVKKTIA